MAQRDERGKGASPPPMAGMPSMKGSGRIFARTMGYVFGRHRLRFLLVITGILVSSLVSVASSLFLQTLIDDYILPLMGEARPVFGGLLRAILAMGGIYLIGVLASLVYNRTMVVIAQSVLKDIRDDMFAHMQTLPVRYFDTHSFGDVMSRYTNDTDTLRQMIAQSLPSAFSSLVTIIAVLISMIALSPHLTLVSLAVVAVMLPITKRLGAKSGVYFIRQQKSLGALNGYIEEMINGQKVVKVFNRETAVKADFDRLNDELCENMTTANKFASTMMPIMMNMGNFMYIMLAIVGGALAVGGIGGVTLGVIAGFLQLSRSFAMPITQVSQQLNSVIMALAGARRIFELLDEEPEEDSGDVTLVNAESDGDGRLRETDRRTGVFAWKLPDPMGSGHTLTRLMGDVRLEDVDFSYDGEKTVLHDVSVFAEPGQKVALVGATGAGKTTITNLINRFYDIAEGSIHYDGIDVKRIKKSDLRRSLGIVLQDVSLFTGTVMENIRYGRLDATDDEVIAAARQANAHDFIAMLPQGYDTVLEGDGSGLSQGQRQLISIARALVADPPVLILDEATSSIDTRTESIVQQGMDALMRGRTVFVIAHRLSTIRNSDVIMVMEEGRIIERGDHSRLMEKGGVYYQLYTGAFELE